MNEDNRNRGEILEMDKPLISVIVSIYNIEKYLGKCISSILGQTYTNLEILLVDDGSTDRSASICDGFAAVDTRIRVIHKENGGAVNARKVGMQAASGLYVCHVDGDDWIEPDLYETVYENGIKASSDMIYYSHYRNYSEEYYSREEFPLAQAWYGKKEIHEIVLPRIIDTVHFFDWGIQLTMWSFVVKKEKLFPFLMRVEDTIRVGDDTACMWPCLLEADSLSVINRHLYHYRQRENSIIHGPSKGEAVNIHTCYKGLFHTFACYDGSLQLKEKLTLLTYYWLFIADYEMFMERGSTNLFPYPDIREGCRIILYGAGTFGKQMYRTITKLEFCEIVSWIDKRHENCQGTDRKVESVDSIKNMEFDYVVIAVLKAKVADAIRSELLQMGIEKAKISLIDTDLLKKERIPF